MPPVEQIRPPSRICEPRLTQLINLNQNTSEPDELVATVSRGQGRALRQINDLDTVLI
jgi:hypothetical protein